MRSALTMLSVAIFLPLLSAPPPAESQLAQKNSFPRLDHHGDPLPEHALLRIGTTRLRPGGVVTNMAFTADGKRLVTINTATGGHVWEVSTGKQLCAFGHPEPTDRTARPGIVGPPFSISSDGSLAVLLDVDGMCRVNDTTTGTTTLEFKFPGKEIQCLCISPDNKRVAANDKGGVAYVWDITPSKTASAAPSKIVGEKGFSLMAFVSDGSSLATLSLDSIVEFWNTATGKQTRALPDDKESGTGWFIIAPAGKNFLTGSRNDQGTLLLRDITTGKKLQELSHFGLNVGPDLVAAIFTQNGKALIVSNFNFRNNCEVRCWDLKQSNS